MSNTNKGLEGVVIGQTAISQVAGDIGQLVYGGYRIEDLAEHVTFEEVCHLLWYGDLPDAAQLESLRSRFIKSMAVAEPILDVGRSVARDSHPMATLRTAVSALSSADPDAEDTSPAANDRKAVRLTAQVITLTAAIERIRNGHEPIAPRADLSLAANLLFMMRGEEADELAERIIDAALILHAEHGMNASTFSARVTASTLADIHSAVTSAIGTLKGPLHGGANEQVMHMLLKIERPENAAQFVRDALDRGEKVMGFGHRVYRTLDPRAPILKSLAEELLGKGGETRWLEISSIIQTTMREEMDRKGKKIYPNVDFFSASVYYTLGVPTDLFTNLFACARMAGWTAHVIEQMKDNRLIRPKAEYVGPRDRTVTHIAQRTAGAAHG
jgi:citrate synthase